MINTNKVNLRGFFMSVAVFAMTLVSISAYAAPLKVDGIVKDAQGEPVIGANVVEKGTTNGTITDMNGQFTLNVSQGSTLLVSYLGYKDAEIIANKSNLAVVLQEDSKMLDDVVVTALGIKKERKALGYSMTDVNSEELLRNKNTNVINSLAGKVPGVNITQSSGAAGAGAAIIIRGGNSASEGRDNQPLFVVDGIIYDNSTSVIGNSGTDGSTRSNTTFSNRVMDINPEDIESMTVLKGAAAAALYGSRAADGAIVITTKKGAEGKIQVDYRGKVSASWATKLPTAQTQFGRGTYSKTGVLTTNTYSQWGEALEDNATTYNNITPFFRNGVIADNNISFSGGSKLGSFYLSASNYDQQGIIPGTGYDKTTMRFNGDLHYGRLDIGANVSYSISQTQKTLTSGGLYNGGGTGAMNSIYTWPTTEDASHYLKEDGTKYRLFEGVYELADDRENPYWIINENELSDKTHRFTGAINASFKIFDWWNLTGRVGYDNYTTDAYTYIAPGGCVADKYQNGRLNKNDYRYEYLSTNIMTDFHHTFGDFDLGLMLGTTAEMTNRNNQTHWGYNFVTQGTISFSNIATENQFFRDGNSKKRLVGVYGEFRAAWKNQLYLTVTGRNDWSSTLPIENRSYFYPSVSGAWVFSELIPKNTALSFGKIRGSWARVGKDANPYATLTYLAPNYSYTGGFTLVGNDYTLGNAYLLPEMQDAWEVGAELKFLNGRLGLDWTYYQSKTQNQIAQPRLSNAGGGILVSINSGSVQNKGMEIALTAQPVKRKNFTWDMALNLSYNRGTLGDFIEGVGTFYATDAQFGTIKGASIPNGGDFLALIGTRFAYETEKDADGNYVENQKGAFEVDPLTGLYKVSSGTNEQVGNREPKLLGGFNNTFSFYNFSINILFDFRLGGAVYNGTEYAMVSAGMDPSTIANNRQEVTVTGKVNKGTASEPIWEDYTATYKAGEQYTFGENTYDGKYMIQQYYMNQLDHSPNFIQDVNWLKLRNLSISYDFTPLLKKQHVIKHLSASVTGTNLFTITNYRGMDPEVSVSGGTGGSSSVGIDYCSVPSTSSFTFGLNISF